MERDYVNNDDEGFDFLSPSNLNRRRIPGVRIPMRVAPSGVNSLSEPPKLDRIGKKTTDELLASFNHRASDLFVEDDNPSEKKLPIQEETEFKTNKNTKKPFKPLSDLFKSLSISPKKSSSPLITIAPKPIKPTASDKETASSSLTLHNEDTNPKHPFHTGTDETLYAFATPPRTHRMSLGRNLLQGTSTGRGALKSNKRKGH